MTTVGTPTGQVIRDDDGVRLEFVRTYPDPISRVWDAVTDPAELGVWYGTWRGDPASGTVELASIEGGGEFKPVQIVECDRPRRVAVVLPTPYGPWPISITLSESGGTTTATFVHQLTEPDDPTSIGPGWHFYLDRLGATLTGATLPEFEDWPSYEPLGSWYAMPD
jgi:uncharacterized protein YndB with AHSA1/START domain